MTMRTWGRRRTLTLLAVSLLGPALAWSQVLTLTPSLTVGERYDDNIFQRSGDEIDQNGQRLRKVDDFITTITPAVQLRYIPRPETVLTFEYTPSLRIFADNDNQNHVSHRLNLDFESPLSRRFSLEVGEELIITEEPGDRTRDVDTDQGTNDASDESRERTIRNTANISLNVGLTPRTSLGLLFENLIEEVEDNQELDEFRYVLGTELGYLTNVARQNRVVLTYQASIFTFSGNCDAGEQMRMICTAQNDQGFVVHTVTAGYEHNLSATLSARAAIGFATTVSDRNDLDGNDALVGSLGFIKTLRTGQFALSYERSFTSGGGTSDEVISNRFIGRLRFRPTPKITLALSSSLAILNFQQENIPALRDDDRVFFTLRPSIQYQILRYLSLNTAYNLALSNFQEGERADRVDHRFSVGAVFAVRAGLFIDLTYQLRNRVFDSTVGEPREGDEFTRNEVILSVTYRPTLRL